MGKQNAFPSLDPKKEDEFLNVKNENLFEKAMARQRKHTVKAHCSKKPSKDFYCSKEYVDQVRWERDMLQAQLDAMQPEYCYEKEIGINPNNYFWNDMLDDERQEYWKKEQKKYGFDERQTWNLNQTIICFLYPRLKMYQKYNYGYPCNLTSEKWENIIQEMIDGFEAHLKFKDEDWTLEKDQEVHQKTQKSFDLLAKYWDDLWW